MCVWAGGGGGERYLDLVLVVGVACLPPYRHAWKSVVAEHREYNLAKLHVHYSQLLCKPFSLLWRHGRLVLCLIRGWLFMFMQLVQRLSCSGLQIGVTTSPQPITVTGDTCIRNRALGLWCWSIPFQCNKDVGGYLSFGSSAFSTDSRHVAAVVIVLVCQEGLGVRWMTQCKVGIGNAERHAML